MKNIEIPAYAELIIKTLEDHNHSAYVVGGCVRDSIMGRTPSDWDICTSATPEEVKQIFSESELIEHGSSISKRSISKIQIIDTGLKHGTVTLLFKKQFEYTHPIASLDDVLAIYREHEQYEVTTYRIDGDYSNNRHPDSVSFTDKIEEDLARRDFSMNAIAYNPKTGFIDPFNGQYSIEERELRCVGNPHERFGEDALRILRAIRFQSTLGFQPNIDLRKAMWNRRNLLENISKERIQSELNKILSGEYCSDVLSIMDNYMVLASVIPEVSPLFNYNQHSPYHFTNAWKHTLLSLKYFKDNYEFDLITALALLLHDIGKPFTRVIGTDGVGHFPKHASVGSDMAKLLLQRLKYDNYTIDCVTELIRYHDATIVYKNKTIRRWLYKIGEEQFRRLLKLMISDNDAHVISEDSIAKKLELKTILEEFPKMIEDPAECFSLKQLGINGNDLKEIGIQEGPNIGKILNILLNLVMDDQLDNDKESLLNTSKILYYLIEAGYITSLSETSKIK